MTIFETLVGAALSVMIGLGAGWVIAAVIRYVRNEDGES